MPNQSQPEASAESNLEKPEGASGPPGPREDLETSPYEHDPLPPAAGKRHARSAAAPVRRGQPEAPGGPPQPRQAGVDHRAGDAVPTRGRADAMVAPVLGTLLGLMALGAVGLVLMSRRHSRAQQSLLAGLRESPVQWLQGVADAENHLVSDLSGRVSRLRRRFGF